MDQPIIKLASMWDAIIAGVFTLLGAGMKLLYDYWKNMRKKTDLFKKGLSDITGVYRVLNGLTVDTPIGRALILKCENGGGIPTVGCELYSTVLYESYNTLLPIKDQWVRQRIDQHYTEMLHNLYKTGAITIATEEMPDCDLKFMYLSAGVRISYVYKISSDKDRLIYLSLNFESAAELSPRTRNKMRAGVTTLQKIFERNERL